MDARTNHATESRGTSLSRTIGAHGRVAVLSGMAGGVAVGGVLVATMTMAGRLSGHALFMNATVLFIAGALLGLLHGTVLGYLGRPLGTTPRRALGDLALAAVYAIPALAVAWLATVWVAMTLVAVYTGRTGPLVAVGFGWIAAAAILTVAAVHAWRALKTAYQRWPERRMGTVLVAATFAALMVTFLADRPEIWGIRLRVTETGAVLLAALLSIWVAGPLVSVALRLLRQVPIPRRGFPHPGIRNTTTDVGVGLVVGLTIGLLTAPFTGPTTATAAAGSLVVDVSRALVDEVLLRLFLVTAVAWLLLARTKVKRSTAGMVAVGAAALVQIVLYTPGAIAIGFPTAGATAGFMVAAVAIPALAFGSVYWKRGLTAAVVADATALIALTLIA